MIKTIVTNYGFNFKPKTVVDDYDFNYFKKFKIIITNHGFGDMAIRYWFERYFETCNILRV